MFHALFNMDKVITDNIDPYVKGYAACNDEVALFEFGEVVVVKNYKENDRVRLVSGGSSCHIEYVGSGMLTAAVQGKWLQSPPPNLILRTLRELTVNLTDSSDLLTSGLAVERADNDDLKVWLQRSQQFGPCDQRNPVRRPCLAKTQNQHLKKRCRGKWLQSPAPNLILRTLRELTVNHVKGLLVIISTDSSDLLTFGLAVERADNDDLKVVLLEVADDCNNDKYPKGGKRGLAGVVLVNKIAGALASADNSLLQIYEICSELSNNILSTGMNIKKKLINIPECMYCKKCAFGVDSEQSRKSSLRKKSVIDILEDIVNDLLIELTTKSELVDLQPGDSVVILVNNLGTLNQYEEYIFARCCMSFLNNIEIKIARLYIGSYLYLKYDMDLTLTVMKVYRDDLLNLLDESCNTTGWKPVFQHTSLTAHVLKSSLRRKCRLSPPFKGPRLKERAANIVQLCIQFSCDALISCEKMLNKIDSEKGDGDTGSRLRLVAEVLNKRFCDKKLNTSCPFTLFLSLSKLIEKSVGSTMGCLHSVMFEAAATTFGEYPEEKEIDAEMWLRALERACLALKKYGNIEFGDRTMYDPLQACATTFRELFDQKRYIYSFSVAVAKAEEVAQATRQPGCKYPDAGAHAVGIWMRAVCEGVKLRCID